jgi:hypothetical protein
MRRSLAPFPAQVMQRRHGHAVVWSFSGAPRRSIGSKVPAAPLTKSVNISLLGTSRMCTSATNGAREVNTIESRRCALPAPAGRIDNIGHQPDVRPGIMVRSRRRCMRTQAYPGQVVNLVVNRGNNLFERSNQSRKV